MLKDLVMTLLRAGGQQRARQNAWACMASDVARARARREADVAMQRALERTALQTTVQTAVAR